MQLKSRSHRLSIAIPLIAAMFGLVSSGCSPTIHQHKLSFIKSAAIVGFEADARPTSTTQLQPSPSATHQAYTLLSHSLSETLGWSMTQKSELTSAPLYASAYSRYNSEGLLNLMNPRVASPTNGNSAGIMWSHHARELDSSERLALMNELKTDALAIAQVNIEPCATRTTAFESEATYQASIKFEVYGRETQAPIWTDRWAVGEPSNMASINTTEERDAAYLEAIKLAYDNLLVRYQTHK